MSEENAGQETTGNDETGQLESLRQELGQANQIIERLRGTQSANDRELSNLRPLVKEYESTIEDLEKSNDALKSQFESANSSVEELSERVQELSTLEDQVRSYELDVNKLRLAATMAGENPAIAVLVETGALPQTDDLESFKESLERIAGGISDVTTKKVDDMMQGVRPKEPNVSGRTKTDAIEEAMSLMESGDYDKGLKLYTEALQMKE